MFAKRYRPETTEGIVSWATTHTQLRGPKTARQRKDNPSKRLAKTPQENVRMEDRAQGGITMAVTCNKNTASGTT